jgi:O-acetylserine/cysteine efflux transporter
MPLIDWLAALLVVTAWGVNFVVMKVALHDVPPMLLGALRFALVAFPAVLFIKRPKVPLRSLFLYALTISLGQFFFLFTAIYVGMPAGLASLVLQSQAFFTVVIGALMLGESVRRHNLLGMTIAAFGLVLVGAAAAPGSVPLLGFALTLAAAVSWAAGNLVLKGVGKVDMLSLVVWGALIPPIPFLFFSWIFEGSDRIQRSIAHISMEAVAAVFYLAFVATVVGYVLWGRLLSRHPVNKVAPLSLLVPVIGLISSSLALGERLSLLQWIGGAVVMAGLAINVFGAQLLRGLRRGALRALR